MKHGHVWERCAHWAGFELGRDQMSALERFRQWLVTEAAAAGAIGPREADRVDDRHIGDSLVMARGIGDVDEVWDIGSGAGLPGVPLAIGLPGKRFVLLDKSGRRVDLLRRVSRILNLQNVVVKQGEIEHLPGPVAAIVSRATLPPERARHEFHRLLAPGGVAVVGGSWSRRPDHVGWESIEVDRTVLDREVWLLIMHQA